jgi:hypothetical protein
MIRPPILLRPRSILGTPKRLAQELGFRLRFYPNPRRNFFLDFRRDLCYILPEMKDIKNCPYSYLDALYFFKANKASQRKILSAYKIPVPRWATTHPEARELAGETFVVRPLHHQHGKKYRLSDLPDAFSEGYEYVSEVFPKTREYRVIYLFGKPVIQLRKKPAPGLRPEDAWNHSQGSYFQTVQNVQEGVLWQKTSFYKDLENFPPILGSHICAVDVLFNSKSHPNYVVCEINSCPSITIPENVKTIVEAVRNR